MPAKQFAKLVAAFARHPIESSIAFRGESSPPRSVEQRLRAGADWLVRAQERSPDGAGYSRRYGLVGGWDRGYVETTGYIIPTMLEVSEQLQAPEYRTSADAAAEWLLTRQTDEGAFPDIDADLPHVFDTGQVLVGLTRMLRATGDDRFRVAGERAAHWLLTIQEPDGSWIHGAYEGIAHSYYSRVGAALIAFGTLLGEPAFVSGGRRNLDWTLDQRRPNGFFAGSSFRAGHPALLHTLVYVLEGFSMAFEAERDDRWAGALADGVDALRAQVDDRGLPNAYYDEAWRPTRRELCVTGLAQYAGVLLDVARIRSEPALVEDARQVIEFLARLQQRRGTNLEGALQSSVPLWGTYGAMDFYNWNVKFFLDAQLKSERFRQAP